VAVIPGRPVRNHRQAQGTRVGEITGNFADVSWFFQCSIVKLSWRALAVCGHPAPLLLYWHLGKAK